MLHSIRLAALALLAGAASLTTVRAQSSFQPGYVLSLSGDTLRGSINYLAWTRSPSRIEFRSAGGEVKSYVPADIRGFGVAQERYESAVVDVDGSPYKVEDLPKSSALQMRRDEAFVRVLFNGAKSLYFYQDRNDKEHFFIRQNGGLELLLYKQFLAESETDRPNQNYTRLITDKSYVDQLLVYLADCPSIKDVVRRAPYTGPGLQKVFTTYYACIGQGTQPQFRQLAAEGPSLRLGVLAGAGSTWVRTITTPRAIVTSKETIDFGRSVKPAGGLFAELVLPRRLRHLSVLSELFYTAFSYDYSFRTGSSAASYTDTQLKLDFRYARVNLLLRYRWFVGASSSVFLNGGAGMGYAFREVSERNETVYFYSQTTTNKDAGFGSENPVEQALMLGLGGQVRHLSAEARVEAGNGFLNGLQQNSKTRRAYLLLGYRF